MNKAYLYFTVISLLLIISCGGSVKLQVGERPLKPVDTYGDEKFKTMSEGDIFVGVSKNWADESSARNDAELDARRKIINSLEMRISNEEIDRYLVPGETGEVITGEVFQDIMTKAVAENILAVKPEGYYIEKWMEGTTSGVKYFFNCWCGICYSKAEHNIVVGKIVEEFMKFSEPALAKGREYQSKGLIRDAIRQYSSVNEWASEFDGYTGINPSLSAKVKTVLYQARELLSGITVLVAVCDCKDGRKQSSTLFGSKLSEALTKESNFAIKSCLNWNDIDPTRLLTDSETQLTLSQQYSCDLLLIGKADVDEVHASEGNYYYIARNRVFLKLVEGVTGNSLWETTISDHNRGYGNDEETAIKRALSFSDVDRDNPFETLSKELLKSLQ